VLESASGEEQRKKRKRCSEAQIAFALRQAESGAPVVEIIRKMGISEMTFYRWKKKYAGMGVAEVRRLRQLEDENQRLKRLVADLTLDKQMLQPEEFAACRASPGPRSRAIPEAKANDSQNFFLT
jgi:putative transposase